MCPSTVVVAGHMGLCQLWRTVSRFREVSERFKQIINLRCIIYNKSFSNNKRRRCLNLVTYTVHIFCFTGAIGPDINLSIQYILNCATDVAGSCHGGSAPGVYEFIKEVGSVPFDTCQPYLACSAESTEGFCSNVDTQCTPENTCVTCNTFSGFPFNGKCKAVRWP